MDSIEALVDRIQPEQTILLCGAGAAIASGAPSGAGLARYLAGKLTPPPHGDDLAEIAAIYEHRVDRRAMVSAVRDRLQGLQPTGALLTLPELPWRALFSTNFDTLVESSYRAAKRSLGVVRSNF